MTVPHVALETAMQLKEFNLGMTPIRKSWGALAMTSDGLVCATSMSSSCPRPSCSLPLARDAGADDHHPSSVMYYLFKSRTSVFHREKKIYHKLNSLIIETMYVPSQDHDSVSCM